MNSPLIEQKALLKQKLQTLARLEENLHWSFKHLPTLDEHSGDNPAVSERVSAIVDRFTKLQDQFTSALRHAHDMLGDKSRTFSDVIVWAVKLDILPDQNTWLELRSLRNRLTHEYDLESERLPELIALIRVSFETLRVSIERFALTCKELHLAN